MLKSGEARYGLQINTSNPLERIIHEIRPIVGLSPPL